MANKRIKITESQLRLLESIGNLDNTKKLKITEAQYQRLFAENKEVLTEGGILSIEFAQFAAEMISLLKDALSNPSQDGLSPFWVKIGVNWGDMMTLLSTAGIIVTTTYGVHGAKRIKSVNRTGIIRKLKALYNEFSENPRYNLKTGEVINYDETPKDEGMVMLGNDMEMSENYPEGASDDPFAPFNQDDAEERRYEGSFVLVDEVYDGNGYHLFFIGNKDNGSEKYVAIVNKKSAQFQSTCGNDVNGDCVVAHLNNMEAHGDLEIGDCGYDCGSHLIHRIDEEMKGYIMEYHADDENVRRELEQLLMVNETTTAGASSGSFEAPLGGSSPIKRQIRPSDGVNEVTDSGSTGSYEQPKIWAKNPKLSRFSKDPMYPEGEILEGEERTNRYVLNLGEVYVYGKNDAEAKAEANNLIKVINQQFGEADAAAKSLHRQGNLKSGAKPEEVDLYESVAKKTGRTVEEVRDIIKKNANKE